MLMLGRKKIKKDDWGNNKQQKINLKNTFVMVNANDFTSAERLLFFFCFPLSYFPFMYV